VDHSPRRILVLGGACATLVAASGCVRAARAPGSARSGSRGDPVASVALTVPGQPPATWNTIVRALTDSAFHYADGNYSAGILTFQSLTRGLWLRVVMTSIGRESTSVVLTGRHYVGHADAGTILANADAWPAIEVAHLEAATLDSAAADIRAAYGSAGPPSAGPGLGRSETREMPLLSMSADSVLRDLGGGRKGFCKANTVRRDHFVIVDNVNLPDWCQLSPFEASRFSHNTWVLEDPLTVPVGTSVEVCWGSDVPPGFEVIEWFTDPTRCPYDPFWRWHREPNMRRLRRTTSS
jgi:hypothetical protein